MRSAAMAAASGSSISHRERGLAALVLALFLCAVTPAPAAEKEGAPVEDLTTLQLRALEQRLSKVERLVQSQGLLELMDRVDRLQAEQQRLQGEFEKLNHAIEQLRKRQRELYLDLDGRLQRIEGRTAGQPPAPAARPVPGTTASSAQPAASGEGQAADPEQEKLAYREAFTLLKAGRYEKAVKAFRDFLASYPQGEYADNAQYWLAQAYYIQHEYQTAREEFEKLVRNYPQSSKVPHAMLKIGISLDELGQTEKARAILEQVRDQYVGSAVSRQASERLAKIAARQP